MKTYLVYFNGVEQPGYIKAGSHNAAEKKAQKKADKAHEAAPFLPKVQVSVAYTEI